MPITIIRNNHANIDKSDNINAELDSTNDGLTGKERVYTVFHNMSMFNR